MPPSVAGPTSPAREAGKGGAVSHGLSPATVAKIHEAFGRHPEIEKAVLYGSRAKGNFKPGSDIDLTLSGGKLDSKIIGKLDWELDDFGIQPLAEQCQVNVRPGFEISLGARPV